MRLVIRPAGRRWPSVPLWALVAVSLWGGTVLGFEVVKWTGRVDDSATICLLRTTTGIPCPTCGSTRAVKSFAAFDLVEGISHNPLVIVSLMIGLMWLALHVVGRVRLTVSLTRPERRVVWTVLIAAFLANWAWVISRH